MQTAQLDEVLQAQLDGRRLLDHPFYVRWSRGEVTVEELRAYAAQYRHFEAALPAHLALVADGAVDPALREQALRNLDDEAGSEPTHLQLFDRFAAAIGATEAVSPSPAMTSLLEVYRRAAASSAAEGFAALLAYEAQSPEVSASKAAGLREHGILDGEALDFWDVHAFVDGDHASWALDALAQSGMSAEVLGDSIRAAADAWWMFLDEREARQASGRQASGETLASVAKIV